MLREAQRSDVKTLLGKLYNSGVGWRTVRCAKQIGWASPLQSLITICRTESVYRTSYRGEDTSASTRGKKPVKPCTARLQDNAMLPLLLLQAWAAVALSYFAGLVRSEIRGLEWGD